MNNDPIEQEIMQHLTHPEVEKEIIENIIHPEAQHNGIKRDEMPLAYILSKLRDVDGDSLDPVDRQLVLALFKEGLSYDEHGNKTQF
jgi:hypothetical protein